MDSGASEPRHPNCDASLQRKSVIGDRSVAHPALDPALLDAYGEQPRVQGVPVDEWRTRGLTSEEMDAALAPLGLRLPIEGRAWWSWHDGARPAGREKLFGPAQNCLSLDAAVAQYRQSRFIAESIAEKELPPLDDPDTAWHPAWFPIKGPGLPVVIDCSVEEGEPTPVRFIDWQNVDGFDKPKAYSFGQMISWWIEALESGLGNGTQGSRRGRSEKTYLMKSFETAI